MKYRQILHIIARTLSLSIYPERAKEIERLIKEVKPDWEDLVKVSSSQYVLPAFYLNLSRQGLMHLLPDDLCTYLELLVSKNRERNIKLIEQADEVEKIFALAGIDSLFLKGMANLKSGLYEDIAERMLGDIDLIVAEADMEDAVQLLLDSGYIESMNYDKVIHRDVQHYPRLQNPAKSGGIDVHRYLLEKPNERLLTTDELFARRRLSETGSGGYVPSIEHLLIHNVLNVQVHDKAHYYGDIHLRQLYDLLLLSRYVTPYIVFEEFGYFRQKGREYFCLASHLFNSDRIISKDHGQARFYVWRSVFISNRNSLLARIWRFELYLIYRIRRNLSLFSKAIFDRDVRKGIFLRLLDASWYKRHIKSYRKL